jgi:thiamine pyrophosphate-dependent acetolactate synthase large subunit-like protein
MKYNSAVAKAVHDNGLEVVFGLIGDANLYMVR